MNQLQFYKPNPKSTGSACSFWKNQEEKNNETVHTFWCSLIKQHSWNSKTRTGSFSENKDNPEKRVIIKFSATEICGLIDAIERNVPYEGYHGSNQVVKFYFKPYFPKKKDKENKWVASKEQGGFSLSVQKEDKEDSTNKQSYVIGFTWPESKLLCYYLETVVKQSFLSKGKNKSKE